MSTILFCKQNSYREVKYVLYWLACSYHWIICYCECRVFAEELHGYNPNITDIEVQQRVDTEFLTWFVAYVLSPHNSVDDPLLRSLAYGPSNIVQTWPKYFVNDFIFHTESCSRDKSANNSGVWVRGSDYGDSESDYYGVLQEVMQVEFSGIPQKRIVLFRCDWFDPTPNHGTRTHNQFDIVEVRGSRRLNKYDPFIFAQQALQAYYTPYPIGRRDKVGWLAVIKTRARRTIDAVSSEKQHDDAYQDTEMGIVMPVTIEDYELHTLRDHDAPSEEVNVSFNEPIVDAEEEEEAEEEEDVDEEEDTEEEEYVDEEEDTEEDAETEEGTDQDE